jgi:short-subunit dehydrogenase
MTYELEGFGIKVILIEPSAVKTNFLENSKQARWMKEGLLEQ